MGEFLTLTIKLALIAIVVTLGGTNGDTYNCGIGISDVTGPAADIGMMGYASPTQLARGIHTRIFSRAFVFESEGQRVVYVSADIGMVDTAIKTEVVKDLQAKYGPTLYTSQNVLLSGTHTHSGPAGYIQYVLYGITSLGFDHLNFRTIVDGIVQSIERAHANIKPSKLFFNKGELLEANINRSPTSYLVNPPEEQAEYTHDVDKDMSLLRIESADASRTPLGSINWFAVHPTSMNNTNRLLSGDNKGYAAMMFEAKMNGHDVRPGKGSFVAAFGSSNLGDVSPNIQGAKCIKGPMAGQPCRDDSTCCDPLTDLCFVANCIAFGPGKDMEESTMMIGDRQFKKAVELFDSAAEEITGPIQFKHQFVNMSAYEVIVTNSEGERETKQLCKAALGYGFAAGTTDGPGMFDFKQGTVTGNPFWDTVKRFLINVTEETEECHRPKPVLLAVGEAHWPYDWSPEIVETQILRIGNLYIVAIPGELTTMAGRRMRKVIEQVIQEKNPGGPAPKVVIAGLSNVYTHYVATFEEYQVQRYEAASTIFGPHTLEAYMQQYKLLSEALFDESTEIEVGPTPPNFLDSQLSLMPQIKQDTTPFLHNFGDVITEPETIVRSGETVTTVFVGGHLKNNPMREGTFFVIEKEVEGSSRWQLVRTDADWDTKLRWSRPVIGSTRNNIEISWKTETDTPEGFYRVRHFGYYKPGPDQNPRTYQGSTQVFQVLSPGSQPQEHPMWTPQGKPVKSIMTAGDFWHMIVDNKHVL